MVPEPGEPGEPVEPLEVQAVQGLVGREIDSYPLETYEGGGSIEELCVCVMMSVYNILNNA